MCKATFRSTSCCSRGRFGGRPSITQCTRMQLESHYCWAPPLHEQQRCMKATPLPTPHDLHMQRSMPCQTRVWLTLPSGEQLRSSTTGLQQHAMAICKLIQAERNSALIHHGLKWNCKHKCQSGDQLRCNTTPGPQMERQSQRSEWRRPALRYTTSGTNARQTQRPERRGTPL
jgi:hypothetical protein